MKLTPIYVGLSLALAAQASWWGSNKDETNTAVLPYSTWSATQLRDWLDTHTITVPQRAPTEAELRELVANNWNSATAWTYDQYAAAQKAFQDLRESSFDAWDESRLREWLLEQGIVSPKGPKEKLVLMAKARLRDYQQAASSFSSRASATASTMVYGDSMYQASKSVSSIVAQATEPVAVVFDETRDYIYSTWDENQMRKYLEEKGVLKTNEQKRKDELLQMMHDAYGKVATPVWQAWSDSYLHNWLVSHNIVKSDAQKNREYYTKMMEKYYYSINDSVWHTWSDSQLRNWLIDNNIIKSDAQIKRDKMLKLIQDNYLSAKNTFWDAWSDNQLKEWLVDHGYMRSDAQVKRDELIRAAEEKYNDVNAKSAAYLTWPDARLRAYLREHGLSDELVPGGRPGLLQEVRIRWVQTEHSAESMYEKARDTVQDVVGRVVSLLTNGLIDMKSRSADQYGAVKDGYDDVKRRTEKEVWDAEKAAEGKYYDAKAGAGKKYDEAKGSAEKTYYNAKGAAEDGYYDAQATAGEKYYEAKDSAEGAAQKVRENVGEKVKTVGSKIKGEF